MKKVFVATIVLAIIVLCVFVHSSYAWNNSKEWKSGNFVDEFGDPTKQSFIYQDRIGFFRNSATSSSYLYAEFLFSKRSMKIELHQYRSTSPAEYFLGDYHFLGMKNSKGQTLKLYGDIFSKWNASGGIKVRDAERSKVIAFLRKSVGDVKVHIQSEYGSVYYFSICADGFIAAWNSTFGK